MAWQAIQKRISETVHHYRFCNLNNEPLTFAGVIELWKSNSPEGKQFREFTTQALCDSPFVAFRWETPVVDRGRLDREFEFVLLNSPALERQENRKPFRDQLEFSKDRKSVTFPNIGRNAVLVVPARRSPDVNHCHMATFLRTAEPEQSDDFWQAVGIATAARISEKPVWLSTAGGGVAWLHVRLDDRPKYYGFAPFRIL